jgi:uncharacterized protein YukE
MSQIITDPAAMLSFSHTVKECSERLKKEERDLFGELHELGATWKDQKYRQFDRLIVESSRELAAFHTAADRYSEYLVKKARAAQRFLES